VKIGDDMVVDRLFELEEDGFEIIIPIYSGINPRSVDQDENLLGSKISSSSSSRSDLVVERDNKDQVEIGECLKEIKSEVACHNFKLSRLVSNY